MYEIEETTIWRKDNWKNPDISYLFNRSIYEYDMKRAGISLCKEYKLLTEETIEKLEAMGKHDADVQIGLMQLKRPEFAKALSHAFASARQEFFHMNDLAKDNILTIKKDAIFTTQACHQLQLGKHIYFRPKHLYSSFCKVGKRNQLELYYGNHNIDVKGIGDDTVTRHKDGILKFFLEFFQKMELEPPYRVLQFLRKTIDNYKNLTLPVDYYRQFNPKSEYLTLTGATFDEYWEEQKEDLNIEYNYYILCNLCKILL